MPPQPTSTHTRLKGITTCLNITADTLETLASDLNMPLLAPICTTIQSLLKCLEVTRIIKLANHCESHTIIQTVKQNKNDCADLMEKTHNLLNAIIIVHITSDTGGELAPIVLKHIGKFTEYLTWLLESLVRLTLFRTLRKIHTFVEAQQKGSKIKKFFRQGEIHTLLNDCNAGL
jgi:hypothetical protein